MLLTAPWHRRSTGEVIARYNARVWASPVARGRLGELPWLESLPRSANAICRLRDGQVAFFVEPERALVVAEFFSGAGAGLEVCPSPATEDRHEFIASLRELEEMDIERVLVAHGPPVLEGGNEAISAALRACG